VHEKGPAPTSPSLKHENAEGGFFLYYERRKPMKRFDMRRNFPALCGPAVGQMLLLREAGAFAGEGVGGGAAGPGCGHPAGSPAHPSPGRNRQGAHSNASSPCAHLVFALEIA